jgi:hypothetical protein
VKIVLQFLKEQGLHQSCTALQEEAGVSLNTLDNPEACAFPFSFSYAWRSVPI